MYFDYHHTAAEIVGSGDPGLLHYQLVEEIDNVARMLRCNKLSKETVAIICWTWQLNNPKEKIYGE